ncbi:MAG TPA: UDP-glucose 4-epimerase [bacterium]|nr:UDP-glucose 4-epimerase [bacterium]
MKHILVTGGAGYIGSITTRMLCDNNFKVTVLDSLENGHKEAVDKRARLVVFNLEDSQSTKKLFQEEKFDAVIDFAAYLSVGESMTEPVKYLRNNVQNFINLLEAMKVAGCRFLIKSSTAAVYGNPEKSSDIPLVETYTDKTKPDFSQLFPGLWAGVEHKQEEFFKRLITYYNDNVVSRYQSLALSDQDITKLRIPNSVYGLTKLLDEIIMKKYDTFSNIKGIALRYFNVAGAYGDGEIGEDKPKPTNLMPLVVLQILRNSDPLQVFGDDYPTMDGTGMRDYIHVEDLAIGHIKALDYLLKEEKSDVFNLGTGQSYSVFEVIQAVERASGKNANYQVVARRSGDPAVSCANPEKAKLLLGWSAAHSLDDMAKSSWKWYNNHPGGY